PSGVSHANNCWPSVASWLLFPVTPATTAVGAIPRRDDTMKWNGRFSLSGAAGSHSSFRIARTIDLMSPFVARYTDAIVEICAALGVGVSSHMSIFVAMKRAVLG